MQKEQQQSSSKVVLITGAAGFIGSNLARRLVANGHYVHVLLRPGGDRWRLLDILESLHVHEVLLSDEERLNDVVAEIKPEWAFHLAHYGGNKGHEDEKLIRETNIEGTAALYRACEKAESLISVVYAGSSSEYGPKTVSMKEDMVALPNTEYGLAKLWATLYGKYLSDTGRLPVTTLRLFHVYGPYEAEYRLVPAVTLALLRGKDPTLPANPNVVRDFVYIDDVVSSFILAAEKRLKGEILNIGNGKQRTLFEAVTNIVKEVENNIELTWGTIEGRFEVETWEANMTHTNEVLGWRPTISLEEGLEKTVAWFKDNKNLYDGK